MDDLVLNIASESTDTGVKKSSKKGGRWTDRYAYKLCVVLSYSVISNVD